MAPLKPLVGGMPGWVASAPLPQSCMLSLLSCEFSTDRVGFTSCHQGKWFASSCSKYMLLSTFLLQLVLMGK